MMRAASSWARFTISIAQGTSLSKIDPSLLQRRLSKLLRNRALRGSVVDVLVLIRHIQLFHHQARQQWRSTNPLPLNGSHGVTQSRQ